MAIDDYYKGEFNDEKYQYELQSLQNRGYTDAYLVSRPFERHDTQSLDFSMQLGTHQVSGVVTPDGTHFLCKFKTEPNDELEAVFPFGSKVELVDNEYGATYEKEGRFYMKFKQLKTEKGKLYDAIHSGNTNEIILPTAFPAFTFFRIPSTPEMGTNPK
jgi:putative protease